MIFVAQHIKTQRLAKFFVKQCGKNMLDVCCDLTPYDSSRWLELKPDRENVTRSGTGWRYFWHERNARVSTRNGQDRIRISVKAYMSSHGNDVIVVGLHGRVVPASTLPTEREFNALVAVWLWEHTKHDACHDT